MAYKFQMGQAILSGALEQEGQIKVENEAGSVVGKILQTGVVSGSGQLQGSSVAVDGVITAHRLAVDDSSTLGCDSDTDLLTLAAQSLTIAADTALTYKGTAITATGAELNYVDVASIGTVEASKAVVVDGNKDASGFRNIGAAQLTTSGRVIVDDATEATSTTDGSLQTDGGLSVAKSAVIGDDLDLLSDAAVLNFGADKDVNLTHVADTGLLLNSSMQMQFGDSGTYIHQSADGVLDLVADTEIEINATTVDINGAVDASSTIVAASSITAGTSFIIGSADLNEVDMEKLDGITNGTAAANKAVVLDGNKDVSGLRDISGRKATLSSLTQGRLVTAGSSGLLEDQAALHYDDARSHGYLELRVSSSASGSAVLGDGLISLADASDNPMFQVSEYVSGNAELGVFFADSAVPVAAPVAGDRMLFQDASDDSRYKKETLGGVRDLFFGAVSGDATIAAGGALTIAASAVHADMLNNDIISGKAELAHADILDADELMISDGGVIKRVGVDSLRDHFFGVVSGDATVADGGALTIAADAVEPSMISIFDDSLAATNKHILIADGTDYSSFELSGDISMTNAGVVSIAADAVHGSMLNDDVISAQTELAADGLATADELLISDGGTLKKIGVDNLFIDGPALLSDSDAVDVSADFFMFLDGGGTGDAKKESIADLVSAMAGSGLAASNGTLAVQGNTVTLRASGDTLAEGYNYFADISSGSVNVTLPGASAPSPGDVVNVKAGDISGGHVLRVSPYANHTIDGESKIDLESPFAAVSLVYVVSGSWRIV